jgi:hypothetical protein
MDMIVFISGLAFGMTVGATVGVLTWLVYGTLNPYGFSLPILVATCLGEAMYGFIGGLLGKRGFLSEDSSKFSLLTEGAKFAVIGFLLTFMYDLFTNVISGLVAGIPLFIALASGIPFALVHELSNIVFFFVGVSPLMKGINRITAGTSYENLVKR